MDSDIFSTGDFIAVIESFINSDIKMRYNVLKKILISIPDDYAVRLLCFTTTFLVCSTICAQIPDTSFFIRKIPTTSSVCRTTNIAVPALMITYGVVSLNNRLLKKLDYQIQTELYNKLQTCHTRLDDYFQFAPATVAFGRKAAGVKSVHKLKDMVILYALSNLLETGVVYTLKTVSSRMRPDGSSNNSFPSGHTATAFVAAEFLHQEYGHKSVWISVGGYTVATLIGVGRMSNNRHWFSDVVAGAGIGILTVKMVYWAYPSLQKISHGKKAKKQKSFVFPSYNNNAFCLNFTLNF
jgi:uncharacterized membrane protein